MSHTCGPDCICPCEGCNGRRGGPPTTGPFTGVSAPHWQFSAPTQRPAPAPPIPQPRPSPRDAQAPAAAKKEAGFDDFLIGVGLGLLLCIGAVCAFVGDVVWLRRLSVFGLVCVGGPLALALAERAWRLIGRRRRPGAPRDNG